MGDQSNYEFERYVCIKETLKQTIEEYGVAIIPCVLDENECNNMVNKIGMTTPQFIINIVTSYDNNINLFLQIFIISQHHSGVKYS